MIYTTYFANLKKLPENIIPISICGKAPLGYDGLQYKKLAPKYDFFMEWKETHDNDKYIECFDARVLKPLTQEIVISELISLLPKDKSQLFNINDKGNENNIHIALVCYETPNSFCHRHLVSKWLREVGIQCSEWVRELKPIPMSKDFIDKGDI